MESIKKCLKGLITRECVQKGIQLQHINVGCEHAERLIEQGEMANYAAKEGVLVAQAEQKLAHYKSRSTTHYIEAA
ncbi:MAG: hypothetical protein OQK04_18390 [Kangiellaceae bacterium]|nr:hypothetical protein [Kangiellaceae bacterium]MCW9000686.1 hypothetical protein [Kangiellaceae bacterium]